ncbi:type II secretion system protein [Oscillibacter sp.]|uniref:type II secretion system protein n=1 Tax=Oscillibacter sp. TaxID=1945593 RepID=UPI001B47B534|nr:prepilin-type N-terminal cleavage/methylation domain-containing protein [Oscillibacter sp.]MBP3509268.1 prepilin-type N-terminal cleavage/methylation domain-containing protein [Oscillibacter sp.]
MRKYKSKNGFTLSELLIVVAIIAVLVAISIPVFMSRLEAARKAVDDANLRSAQTIALSNFYDHGCVASDCPGNCGTSHNSGCWYDLGSGRILSSGSPTEGYNQAIQIVSFPGFPDVTLQAKEAAIWTGNQLLKQDPPTISIYWSFSY